MLVAKEPVTQIHRHLFVDIIKKSIATHLYCLLLSLSASFKLTWDTNVFVATLFQFTLNSISTHNHAKALLLKAYITIYQFDIICISKNKLSSYYPI